MQQNDIVIAGNLAADAKVIKGVSAGRDMLALAVYTNRSLKDKAGNNLTDVHNVVRFGKEGIFDNFATKLLKGVCVQVTGSTENRNTEKDGQKYYDTQVNASFPDGSIDIMKANINKNRQEISGFLAQDAIVRQTANGEVLNMVVITSKRNPKDANNPFTARHSVVKFTNQKGEFSKLAEMLKTGAGVTTEGSLEHYKSQKGDQTYYNTNLNATFQRVQVTKYVTEKPAQSAQQAPAQQAPAQQAPQGEPQEPLAGAVLPNDKIPF